MKEKLLLLVVSITIIAIGFIFLRSNGMNTKTEMTTNKPNYKTVNTKEFSALVEKGDGFLLDVHIPEQTHIPATDAFIPYNEIAKNSDRLPKDKNTPLLVYCRSGSMSKEAASELINLGYTNVYDLAGGINEYKESNVEVIVTPNTIDLGTVVYGDVSRTDFTLTNFTPAPLKVTRVSTSCGCTKAEVARTSLDAYSSTTVKVSFDPAVHKDDTDLGDITRTIYIETDNPNFPKITATITAKVIKEN